MFLTQCREKCVCSEQKLDLKREHCAIGRCRERRLSPRMVQIVHAVVRNALQIRDARGSRQPTLRFHDLRHTAVSLLLDLGVPPHVVREIVGHADVQITMAIYAHASDEEKRSALHRLGDSLG